MLGKLGYSREGVAPEELNVKIPVPNSAAGGIIGKAGATIKALSEESGARVQLSQKDEMHPELNERLCSISGALEQVLKASDKVLLQLQEGDCRYTNMSTSYAHASQGPPMGAAYGGKGGGGYGGKGGGGYQGYAAPMVAYGQPMNPYGHQPHMGYGGGKGGGYGMTPHSAPPQMGQAPMMSNFNQEGGQTTITMHVEDNQVGIIVGKGGSTIKDIQMQSTAKVNVSQRDGTGGPRVVTISGDPQAVANAQMMVTQKITEASYQQRPY